MTHATHSPRVPGDESLGGVVMPLWATGTHSFRRAPASPGVFVLDENVGGVGVYGEVLPTSGLTPQHEPARDKGRGVKIPSRVEHVGHGTGTVKRSVRATVPSMPPAP